jgi:hypothetical protein
MAMPEDSGTGDTAGPGSGATDTAALRPEAPRVRTALAGLVVARLAAVGADGVEEAVER